MLTPEPQFCGCKKPVHDQHIAVGAIIDEVGLAVGADDEERWHLALDDPLREFDINFPPVIIRRERPPRWAVALDRVPKGTLRRIWNDGSEGDRARSLANRFWIVPGNRRHVGPLAGAKLDQVGAPVGI